MKRRNFLAAIPGLLGMAFLKPKAAESATAPQIADNPGVLRVIRAGPWHMGYNLLDRGRWTGVDYSWKQWENGRVG